MAATVAIKKNKNILKNKVLVRRKIYNNNKKLLCNQNKTIYYLDSQQHTKK